jgi:TrmH family RNA methyltransferase
MPFAITSPHNDQLKSVLRLEKRAERDRRRLTLVEGVREVERALAAGHMPAEAWVSRPLVQTPAALGALARLETLDAQRRTRLFEVPPDLFARLAVREESGGILLLVPYLTRPLARMPLRNPAFLLVVEGVEKPGNLGAILRSADAAGVDGVIVSAGATDVHNPNVVRASLGTLFSVPICEANGPETIAWLRANGVRMVAASPHATVDYTHPLLEEPVALVLGSEALGLSPLWADAGATLVRIPMAGIADSLNLSTAAAILLFEVVRRRRALAPAPPAI